MFDQIAGPPVDELVVAQLHMHHFISLYAADPEHVMEEMKAHHKRMKKKRQHLFENFRFGNQILAINQNGFDLINIHHLYLLW